MALHPLARRSLQVAAACLLALAGAAPADAQAFEVQVTSLREVFLTLEGSTPAAAAPLWRAAADGDASGSVSAEEYSVLASAMEWAAVQDSVTVLDAYTAVWDMENRSGAHPFTVDGRSNLSLFIVGVAPGLHMNVTLDNVTGVGAVSFFSLTHFAGPVGANESIGSLWTMTFRWDQADTSVPEHRLVVLAPPGAQFEARVPGSFEVRTAEGLVNMSLGEGRGSVSGTTVGAPVAVGFAGRAVTMEALMLVVAVLLAPAAVVIYAAVIASNRHRTPEEPLPVVPKY